MLRILLVDDEKEILDWLRELFLEQQQVPLEVFAANSGSAALKVLNTIRMDIVLSDIRMPGMTGLQLMNRIRDTWPDCRVLFLTGYSEFEYVYTAIQQESVGYLLKTEDDAVILDTVVRVAREVEAARQAERERLLLTTVVEQAKPHLKREYLLRSMVGNRSEPEMSRRGWMNRHVSERDGPNQDLLKRAVEETGNPKHGLQIQPDQPVYLLSGRLDSLFVHRGDCLADPRLDLLKIAVEQLLGRQFLVEASWASCRRCCGFFSRRGAWTRCRLFWRVRWNPCRPMCAGRWTQRFPLRISHNHTPGHSCLMDTRSSSGFIIG